MPSTNKTPNLGLNNWVGTDKPTREDFNKDNSKLDDFATAIGDPALLAKLPSADVTPWHSGNFPFSPPMTWDVILKGSVANGTPIYGARGGDCYQIGSLYFLNFNIAVKSFGGLSGIISIANLPAIPKAAKSFYFSGSLGIKSANINKNNMSLTPTTYNDIIYLKWADSTNLSTSDIGAGDFVLYGSIGFNIA